MASTVPARKVARSTQNISHVPAVQDDAMQEQPSPEPSPTLYTLLMTAVNFVAFLFSLLAVEAHYTLRRSSLTASSSGSWLRRLLLPAEASENYYHSNQKKLFKMEAEDAFRMRNRTLVVLVAVTVGGMGTVWYLSGILYRRLVLV